ncbi:hypothetical protein ACTL32_09465 [Planococcus sp. FY231025]|uniref:hypothetical protein n=1 Tax=Planococcus sp. FY231025 TaxID=3455699 RepID=UPI003F915EB8
MIQVSIDEKALEELYLQKVEERLNQLESHLFYMNSKQLQNYMNVSWSTIEKHFLYDEKFGAIRLGSRWLFNKKIVDEYLENHYWQVRQNGGDMLSWKEVKDGKRRENLQS